MHARWLLVSALCSHADIIHVGHFEPPLPDLNFALRSVEQGGNYTLRRCLAPRPTLIFCFRRAREWDEHILPTVLVLVVRWPRPILVRGNGGVGIASQKTKHCLRWVFFVVSLLPPTLHAIFFCFLSFFLFASVRSLSSSSSPSSLYRSFSHRMASLPSQCIRLRILPPASDTLRSSESRCPGCRRVSVPEISLLRARPLAMRPAALESQVRARPAPAAVFHFKPAPRRPCAVRPARRAARRGRDGGEAHLRLQQVGPLGALR